MGFDLLDQQRQSIGMRPALRERPWISLVSQLLHPVQLNLMGRRLSHCMSAYPERSAAHRFSFS